MALKNRSVETIDGPQFVNLEPVDVNPLMSSATSRFSTWATTATAPT
jgi:hypothetical protein